MKSAIRSYLVIWGAQCEPDEITRRTGIQPSKTWRIGDLRYAKTHKHHTDSGWRLDAAPDTEQTVDAQIEALFNAVEQSREHLRALATFCELQVTLVLHYEGAAPPLNISAANIERIASLHASLDIDIYHPVR